MVDHYNKTYYNMTGAANGRIYYKISNWYTVLSFLPLSGKIIPVWQDMMGVADKAISRGKVNLTPVKRIATYFNVISEAFSVRKNMEKLNESFPATEKYFREHFTSDISLEEIKKLGF